MQAKTQDHQLAIWVKYHDCHENLIKHLLGLVIVHGIQMGRHPALPRKGSRMALVQSVEVLWSMSQVPKRWRCTSMTSDSLLCLGYKFCPAKGSCGRRTGSNGSIRELVRDLNLKLLEHLDYLSTCLRSHRLWSLDFPPSTTPSTFVC